ncbi:MAG: glycosyltransferase family 39 protein [Bacilli bacterium]|nr:glycosyltransferase family 39 protein [Bacilli bacterium]
MLKWCQKNKEIILLIIILSGIMGYFITQKKGFHEDEMYSYGASNYKYDNVYRPYGYAEVQNDYLFQNILKRPFPNQITGLIQFLINENQFQEEFDPILKAEIPKWKTKEEAKEYITVQKEDLLNFFSIWYNEWRDIHPPMFYNLLHIFSSFYLNNFSKYIGFFMNLTLFILTLIGIYQIMIRLRNKKWALISAFLYGGSMGAISTVMFQRMYMMLACFAVWYLYYALKFWHKKGQLSKKEKCIWSLIIIGGFLTQYYFCIYVVLIFFIFLFILVKKKKWLELKNLFWIHALSALIGIILFPNCIIDIFFSYRGLGASQDHTKTYLEFLLYYLNASRSAYSIPLFFLIGILAGLSIFLYINRKKLSKIFSIPFLICLLPILGYIFIISKIAPFLGENYTSRYIMMLYPVMSMTIVFFLSKINYKHTLPLTLGIIILITSYGLFTQTPTYLYQNYETVQNLATKHQEKHFIYIFDNYFTHLTSMPEFMTYEKSLIINHQIYDFQRLKQDQELKQQKEIILCIKNWLNTEELLQKVLDNTDFKTAEPLLEIKEDIQSNYYLLKKNT